MSTQSPQSGSVVSVSDAKGKRVTHRKRRSPSHQNSFWPILFVGPLMLGIAVFYYFPIVKNFYLSFTKTSVFGDKTEWVGLANYQDLFTRPDFLGAVTNTLIYTGAILISVLLSILIASCIEAPGLRGRGFYRIVFFMPYLAMPMAISQVWKLVFNGNFGLMNQILKAIGISEPPYWLSTPGFALAVVCLFGIWSSIGFNVIILCAGLQAIPKELYEAAAIDGASRVQQFLKITVPLLTPQIFLLAIVQTISGFQLFDALFAIIGSSNPAMKDSRSIVYLFYQQAFINNDKGGAAAIAMVIMIVVGIVTVIQFRAQRKWVQYV